MKHKLFIIAFVAVFTISCNNKIISQVLVKIDADSLVADLIKYRDKKVEIEGIIIHICGVDGKKMKLMTNSGTIIKIVPKDSLTSFDKSFYKNRVKVKGLVKEYRIEITYIDKIENDRTLLCHIDNEPCKDTAWISSQIEKGTASSLLKQDINSLRNKMEQMKKDYVSVITIFAEKVEIIEMKGD